MGDPDSNPHSATESYQVAMSQSLILTYLYRVASVSIKTEERIMQSILGGHCGEMWNINEVNKTTFAQSPAILNSVNTHDTVL